MFIQFNLAASLMIGDMLFYAASFILLLWLIKIFAWRPVTEMMQKRADKISDDIDSAEKLRMEADVLEKKRQDALINSRQESLSIVNVAKQQGQKKREKILADTQIEVLALKQNAKKSIEQQRQDALLHARNDVADLSIEIASKIIQKELKSDDQKALIDSYIEGLGK